MKTIGSHIRRNLFVYFFMAVQVLFLVWIITAGHSAANDIHHTASNGDRAAKEVGTTIGIGLVVGLWVATDVILGIGRFVVLFSRRSGKNKG